MITSTIYSALSTNAGIVAASAVIRPIILAQSDSLPGITYSIEKEFDEVFEGQSGYETAKTEINIYGSTLEAANNLTTSVKEAIASIVGVGVGIKVFTTSIKRIIEDYESDPGEYRVNLQFIINYSED